MPAEREGEGERLETLEKAFCSRQTIKSFAIHKDSIQMTGVHISDLDGAQTPAHQLTGANVSHTAR